MSQLDTLIQQFNLAGLKTSFEDEGALLGDVHEVVRLANIHNLSTTIKIGGCEAKTDLITCQHLCINNLVAPMIESSFAVKKYVEAVREIYKDSATHHNFYINIESIAAVNQAEEIILAAKEFLAGVVVGRSDLSKSLGLTKQDTNSDLLLKHTRHVLEIAKKYGLQTTIGGNINSAGHPFIKTLFNEKLLDRIETRLVICHVDETLLENYQDFVDGAIEVEKELLENRLRLTTERQKKINKRITSIKSRTNFLNNVNENEKSVLVVDFDNVIHEMDRGYLDGTIYGNIIAGTRESLRRLSERYKIVVYTCKANPERPLVDGKNGTELIWEWLEKNNLKSYIEEVTFNKPNAVAYIDDKALEFRDWKSCLRQMEEKGFL